MKLVTELLESIGISWMQYSRMINSKIKSVDLAGISIYYDNKICNKYIEHISYRKRRHQEYWDCISILLREEYWIILISSIIGVLRNQEHNSIPETILLTEDLMKSDFLYFTDNIRIDFIYNESRNSINIDLVTFKLGYFENIAESNEERVILY